MLRRSSSDPEETAEEGVVEVALADNIDRSSNDKLDQEWVDKGEDYEESEEEDFEESEEEEEEEEEEDMILVEEDDEEWEEEEEWEEGSEDDNHCSPIPDVASLSAVLTALQNECGIRGGCGQYDTPVGIPQDPLVEHRRSTHYFEIFLRDPHNNGTLLIPGGKGTGRSTLLRALFQDVADGKERYSSCTDSSYEYFQHYIDVGPLYLSDAIHCDETDPRLSFGGSTFIKLQYRVLHAATGAPPALFSKVVLEIRRRLGLENWFAFPNDVLYGAVRKASWNLSSRLLILVDDTHPPDQPHYPIGLPPPNTNSLKDLHRLHYTSSGGETRKTTTLIIGVTTSNFGDPKSYRNVVTIPPPDPKPHIEAAREILRLAPDSQRMDEVRYMLRHAAVHARFLSDTYHMICAGGLTSVADFDAQFHAFVSPRIEQFLAHCLEQHLDPHRLFDLLAAKEGSNIIEPITIAADALGLCTITLDFGHPSIHIHPKVFVMLWDAVFTQQPQPDGGTNPDDPPCHLPLLISLRCLAHRVNALPTALMSPEPTELDLALITLAAQCTQLAVEASVSSQKSGAEVPLYLDSVPRAVNSFPEEGGRALSDPSGLLADPSTAPALQSMAAHDIISGALHGLDAVCQLKDQARGSLTFGLVLIDADTEDRAEANIKKHRQYRADWWAGVKSTNSCNQAADFFAANIFVHLFVVETDGSCRRGSCYSNEPFTMGDLQCFEVVVEKAELDKLWPVAARITTNH